MTRPCISSLFRHGCLALGLLLCSVLPLPQHSAAAGNLDPFEDWIQTESVAYRLLSEAARASRRPHWLRQRIRARQPLPQASARDFARLLAGDPTLSPSLRLDLRSWYSLDLDGSAYAKVSPAAKSLDEALREMEAKAEKIEQARKDNVYTKGSVPDNTIRYEAAVEAGEWSGFVPRQGSSFSTALRSAFRGQVEGVAGYRIELDLRHSGLNEGGAQPVPGVSYLGQASAVTLLLDNPFAQNLEIGYGGYNLNFSNLIYSKADYWHRSPFYEGALSAGSVLTEAPAGTRDFQGLYARKMGSQRWWPFSDTQLALQTTPNFYESYELRHMQEGALRLDMAGLRWIPLLDDARPYFTFYASANDPSQLNGFNASPLYPNPLPASENNAAMSVALESQVRGGGSLNASWAVSDWRQGGSASSPNPRSYQDWAAYAIATKSIGRLTLGLDAATVGPRFVVGGRRGRGTDNFQSGATLDSSMNDPRPSQTGSLAWQTLATEPNWMVNNTQKAGFQVSWRSVWGSLSASGGIRRQVEPSGPWVRSAFIFENNPYNGHGLFTTFGPDYYLPAPGTAGQAGYRNQKQLDYNNAAAAPAYDGGVSLNDPAYNPNGVEWWNRMAQLAWRQTYQDIVLSQAGIGDSNLREDSVKFFNHARLDLLIDAGAWLGSSGTRTLRIFAESRDTAESAGLPSWGQASLVGHHAAGADLVWALGTQMEMVGTAGWEAIVSQASLYEVHWQNQVWGGGLNIDLGRFVSSMKANLRWRQYSHRDLVFSGRSFEAWSATLGTSLEIWN